MNILMVTNTYLPMVGGVARSVASFTEEFRRRGHRVMVIAPTYENMPEEEEDVLRVPAIQNFNGSDFSVRLPIPVAMLSVFDSFQPDIVHTHHPFLLGDTALRIAAMHSLPVVFTHHTMYERYTHYVPVGAMALRGFVAQLATEYANLCDHVVAPSESIAAVLRQRLVLAPISVIPTGIDPKRFARGNGRAARRRYGMPPAAFVVGHVGRLAPEKNLGFLARAVASFVASDERACFLVVGSGPSQEEIRFIFEEQGLASRLFLTGPLEGKELANAYHAMDVFAFASQTETQGMVLAEAMTAGVPVVALDAPGAREVVQDGRNGRLLPAEDEAAFTQALRWIADLDPAPYRSLVRSARATVSEFSLERCAGRMLELYNQLIQTGRRLRDDEDNPWTQTLGLVEAEWNLWSARVGAIVKTIVSASL